LIQPIVIKQLKKKKMSYKSKLEGGICEMPLWRFIGLLRPFFFIMVMTVFLGGCTKDENPDILDTDPLKSVGINEVIPANLADSVEVNPVVSVTFKPGTDPSKLSASTLTLKKGSSSVPGKTTISGSTAMFTPNADLTPDTEYTATIKTGQTGGSANFESPEYSWKFRTGKHHHNGSLSVVSTDPDKNATGVPVAAMLTVTFNQELTSSMRSSISIALKNGHSFVEGILAFSGNAATFKPKANLASNAVYSGTVKIGSRYHDDRSGDNYYWSFTTGGEGNDVTAPSVNSVVPANNAASVVTESTYTVTFSEPMDPATITQASITLKQGTVSVAGTVTYSGTTARFTPSAALSAGKVYTGTVTTAVKDVAGNALASSFSSSFTTAAAITDITAPTILLVTPANNATSVVLTSGVTVTFSEAMNSTTINSTTFTLKQGSAIIGGTVSYSGTNATFTPSAVLSGSTLYTGTITTGAKDAAGNALTANYVWSFTTAVPSDGTAPTVISVTPSSNAVSVAVNIKPAVTFSEAMTASSITSTTFTLKQGSTVVAGTVSYSGTTATFTPSADLSGNTVYTGTMTTGAKDAAGNALASNYTWTFTTVATPASLSFASDVVPVLNLCNNCHTHSWTTSSNASTFYTNLVNGGYVNQSSPTTSKIYTKLNSGHPGSGISTADINKILNWMSQGSKNN
jgi:hypothetical protein